MHTRIALVVDNIRSCHNVGSLFRTADGLGIDKIILCGITPFPKMANDPRLPYLSDKINKKISKTSLGAEQTVKWEYCEKTTEALKQLKEDGYQILALEQAPDSTPLTGFKAEGDIALMIGNEIEGVNNKAITLTDGILEIPMKGKKGIV